MKWWSRQRSTIDRLNSDQRETKTKSNWVLRPPWRAALSGWWLCRSISSHQRASRHGNFHISKLLLKIQNQTKQRTMFCHPAVIEGMHLENRNQFYYFLPNCGTQVCVLTTWMNVIHLQSEAACLRWPQWPDLTSLKATGQPAPVPNGLSASASLAMII